MPKVDNDKKHEIIDSLNGLEHLEYLNMNYPMQQAFIEKKFLSEITKEKFSRKKADIEQHYPKALQGIATAAVKLGVSVSEMMQVAAIDHEARLVNSGAKRDSRFSPPH